jgi:hypothetical protein
MASAGLGNVRWYSRNDVETAAKEVPFFCAETLSKKLQNNMSVHRFFMTEFLSILKT